MVNVSLADKARSALLRSRFFDSRWLDLDVRDGVVVLRGVLPSFYQKQMAQEQVRGLAGVAGISNEIQVQERRRASTGSHPCLTQEPYVTEWSLSLATEPVAPIEVAPIGSAVA